MFRSLYIAVLIFAFSAGFLAAEGGTATAYRAINPAFADSTEASGQFYQSGAAGRLGNDGIYANSTPEGAIAEFQYHNPGVNPAVFEVQYPVSPTLNISPPSGYFNSPLPFTKGAVGGFSLATPSSSLVMAATIPAMSVHSVTPLVFTAMLELHWQRAAFVGQWHWT